MLFSQTQVFSQQYHPFPTHDATWKQSAQGIVGPGNVMYFNDTFFLNNEDTILLGDIYHKIYRVTGNTTAYYGAVREDSSKKVFLAYASGLIQTMYDFGLHVGDTTGYYGAQDFSYPSGIPYVVTSIDSVFVSGDFHKRFNFFNWSLSFSVIEGVGNTKGLFFNTIGGGYYSSLDCFVQDSFAAYPNGANCNVTNISLNEFNSHVADLFPNPNNGNFFLELTYNAHVSVTNALGELVYAKELKKGTEKIDLQNQTNGIYFIQIITNNGIKTLKIIKE